MSAGDQITITINATTLSAGTVTLENVSTGKSVSKSLTAPSSSVSDHVLLPVTTLIKPSPQSHLGGQNAEWIVEDFVEGDSLVKFCDFGTVTFTDASASTAQSNVGVTNGTVIDIEQSKVLTSVTVNNDSSLTITYQ